MKDKVDNLLLSFKHADKAQQIKEISKKRPYFIIFHWNIYVDHLQIHIY